MPMEEMICLRRGPAEVGGAEDRAVTLEVALTAGARYGPALAGGYAVQAHGMGTRPSGDVDLFTSWQHRDEFPELTSAVIAALDEAGYSATWRKHETASVAAT